MGAMRIRASLSVPVSIVDITDELWGCYTFVSFDGPGYVA